jgi:hypothetical protein
VLPPQLLHRRAGGFVPLRPKLVARYDLLEPLLEPDNRRRPRLGVTAHLPRGSNNVVVALVALRLELRYQILIREAG